MSIKLARIAEHRGVAFRLHRRQNGSDTVGYLRARIAGFNKAGEFRKKTWVAKAKDTHGRIAKCLSVAAP